MALNRIQKIILIVVVLLISTMIIGYILYNHTGWKSIKLKKGENLSITDSDPTLVSKLRFKKCKFTIKGTDGTTKTIDVSSILNNMAAAYKDNTEKGYVFKLDDPGLSVHSFRISGFNDGKNKPDPVIWDNESNETEATLEGNYKLLN